MLPKKWRVLPEKRRALPCGALTRVEGPHRKMYIGAHPWRVRYIDEVRLNKRRKYKSLQALKSLTVGAGETAQWLRAFAALPGDGAQLPALTLEGSTNSSSRVSCHSFLASEVTADL